MALGCCSTWSEDGLREAGSQNPRLMSASGQSVQGFPDPSGA